MSKNIDKWIDFNQFPMDNNGRILWKKCVGLTFFFYYYNEKHSIKILNYGNPSKDYIEIKIDDMQPEVVNTQKIRNLSFNNLFAKPDYLYNVGDIVNDSIILEQLYMQRVSGKGYKEKHYKCKCLNDGYEYIIREKEIKNGRKCPKCVGKVLIVGHNDLATTDPNIVKLLLDKNDGYKYSRCSSKYVWVVCPFCGHKKFIKIEDLVLKGLSCTLCSDGLSYPNKFAHNVFEQISEQYDDYISEYSPDWAGKMRYDNYILLKDGQKIVVEMDGGLHYKEYGKRSSQNDTIKDNLAKEHNIKVVRINCCYDRITERFQLIKNNFINGLKNYFDLSYVDWDSANENGISNKLVEVVNYYNKHPFVTNQQIADYFRVNVITIRHYLTVGEKIGLCRYVRHDPNRYKTSIPLALYDSNGNFIKAFISSRHMEEEMSDMDFRASSIRDCSRSGKPYKGYFIKKITWEEYEQC